MSTLATNAITDASGGNTASINGYTPTVSNMAGRNRIINGDMRIDQRNEGASVSNANGFTLDRWYLMRGASSSSPVFNVQQSTTAPSNYKNSLLVTVGTSGAPGTANYSTLVHLIEGLNVSDFGWGTAAATDITVSFWVNCSVTGTYGMSFQNNDVNRSYIATYTVNAANTWEQKTVTIPGDTSGTWLTTNGAGLRLYWDLGVGTVQSFTAGSWQAENYLGLTSGTKLSNTSGATFYITGVQLEAGSVATPFENVDYSEMLRRCQRYYEEGGIAFANQNVISGSFCVSKRTTPTMARIGSIYSGAEAGTFLPFNYREFYVTGGSTFLGGYWTASAEL